MKGQSDRHEKLKWNFPPTWGGVAQRLNKSSKEFFTADSLKHVVREVIQNSLDAKDSRYPDKPVVVKMEKIEIERELINADDLTMHVHESLKFMRERKITRGIKFYEAALKTIKKPKIPTLKIVDENTIGLRDDVWSALVYEGNRLGSARDVPYTIWTVGASASRRLRYGYGYGDMGYGGPDMPETVQTRAGTHPRQMLGHGAAVVQRLRVRHRHGAVHVLPHADPGAAPPVKAPRRAEGSVTS